MTDIVYRMWATSEMFAGEYPRTSRWCQEAADEIERLRKNVDKLNQMLRDTGYGQGQIDAYVAQCEEIDRLRAEIRRLHTCESEEMARLRARIRDLQDGLDTVHGESSGC